MAATVERAKANDPKALKQGIARLNRELAKVPQSVPAPELKVVEVEVVSTNDVKRLEDTARQIIEQTNTLLQELSKVTQARSNWHAAPWHKGDALNKVNSKLPTDCPTPVAKPKLAPRAVAPIVKRDSDAGVGKAQQRVLDAITLFERLGMSPVKRINAAFFAGYTENGHFNNLMGSLNDGRIFGLSHRRSRVSYERGPCDRRPRFPSDTLKGGLNKYLAE